MATKRKKPRTAAQRAATARMLAANRRSRPRRTTSRARRSSGSSVVVVRSAAAPALRLRSVRRKASGMKTTFKSGWKQPSAAVLGAIVAAILNMVGRNFSGPLLRGAIFAVVGGWLAIMSKKPGTRAIGTGAGIVGVLVALSSFMDSETFLRGPGRRLSPAEIKQLRDGIRSAARNAPRMQLPINADGGAAPRYGLPIPATNSRMGLPIRGSSRSW